MHHHSTIITLSGAELSRDEMRKTDWDILSMVMASQIKWM